MGREKRRNAKGPIGTAINGCAVRREFARGSGDLRAALGERSQETRSDEQAEICAYCDGTGSGVGGRRDYGALILGGEDVIRFRRQFSQMRARREFG